MGRKIGVYVDVEISEVLHDIDDSFIREECERRGIKLVPDATQRTDAKFADAITEMEYEFDTLLHVLRVTFLARDRQHFDVILARCEARYRTALTVAIAAERVKV